jgi:PAS domain S-box-containing protein
MMDQKPKYEELEKLVNALQVENDEIRKGKQAIEESEALHRLTLENISDTVIITDDHGKIIYACPNAGIIFGLSQDQVYAKGTIQELINGNACDLSELKRVNEIPNIEWTVVDSSGHERFVLITAKSVSIKGGTALYVMRDITERKRAEEAFRQERDKAQKYIDIAGVMLVALDFKGEVTLINHKAKEILGYEQEEIIGKNWFDNFLPVRVKDQVRTVFNRLLAGDIEAVEFYENPVLSKDCGERIISWQNTTLKNDEGDIIGILCSGEDITERKWAEAENENLQSQLSNALEMAHLGHWECDVPNNLFTFNDYFYKIFRTTAEEIGGYTMTADEYAKRFLHPDDLHLVGEEMQKAIETTDPNFSRQLEHRIIYADGTVGHIAVRFFIVKDAHGRTVRTYGVNQDITERKQAERELLLKNIVFDTSIVANSTADLKGIINQANDSFVRMWGYKSKNEVIGNPISHFLQNQRDVEAIISSLDKTGEWTGDYPARKKDGSTFIANANATILYDETGKKVGYQSSVQDITERKEAEDALRKSQKMLARTESIAHIGSWEWGIDTDTVTWSEELFRIFQLDPDERAPSWAEHPKLYHPEDFETLRQAVEAAVTDGKPYEMELRAFRKDGETRVCQARGFAELRSNGKPVRLFGSLHDITDRKRMEKELLRAQKLESLGLLAGGIAHDFNNILTTIIGNIAMARMQARPEDEIFELLKEAEAASTRAQALTKQLLTFAKGGMPVKETASIKDIIKESSSFVLRGSKSRCEFSIAEDLWQAEVDVGQISQMINNLVINADQAMPKGGTIQVAAENLIIEDRHNLPVNPGRYIRISIKDQGVGISEDHLLNIFDPYFTTKQKGSGLGLATTYSVIEKHDGHITVESQLGTGTTFHVYLPASDKTVPEKEEVGVIKGQGRILVMDDEAALKKMIGRMLEKLGYEAEFAKDGAEAIEMYKAAKKSEKTYDAVILDLTIPGGMGGKEAIQKLLEIDPEVKAIVSSGYSDDPVLSNFQEYGFKGMMPKPFESRSLGKVLHEVLKGKRKD